MKKIIFILLFCIAALKSNAQNYPIQLTTLITPPFSGYLPDFANPGNEQLKILAVLTDFTEPSYDIKLKIKIQGQGITLESKAFYFSGPYNLTPGIPLEITSTDLAGLLNFNNLDVQGLNLADYNLRKVLPEGFYTICITAYDYTNPLPIQVSNISCNSAWFVLNDPPMLNVPLCGNTINIISPQQVTFSWTPFNMVSPNSFNSTEYEFSLYEVRPAGQNPNVVIQTTAPVFQTITNLTILNYGLTEPPLLAGMEYVWRVRAKDMDGRDLFRNQGYSQVCTFTWGSIYDALGSAVQININAQALTHRQARVWWDSLNIYSNYRMEFRKQNGTGNWFPVNTSRSATKINNLESSTTYEVRVQGEASDGYIGPWSNTALFTTAPSPVYACGENAAPINTNDFKPLQQAMPNMIIQCGQFEMILTQLYNAQSISGKYSGLGKIVLPFGGFNVRCAFTNITIDENQVMVAGRIDAINEGIDAWLSGFGNDPLDENVIHFNEEVDSIYVDINGNLMIIDTNGNSTPFTIDPDEPYQITDANGDTWIVLPGGGIYYLSPEIVEIIKQALVEIKAQHNSNYIGGKKQSYTSARSDLIQNGAEQGIGNIEVSDDPYAFSGEDSTITAEDNIFREKSIEYLNNRFNYQKSQFLYLFSKNLNNSAGRNFIAQWMKKDEMYMVQYLTEQLAAGNSVQQLVVETKAVIEKFIEELILKNK